MLCLLSSFLVGSHATETALSDDVVISDYSELGITEQGLVEKYAPELVGIDVEVVNMGVSSKARSGYNNTNPRYDVLFLAEGMIREYKNCDISTYINPGRVLSQVVGCFYIFQDSVTFTTVDEININWHWYEDSTITHYPNNNMDLDILVGKQDDSGTYTNMFSHTGGNNFSCDVTFKPPVSVNGKLIIYNHTYREGINHWYGIGLWLVEISSDTTENKLTSKISGFFKDLGGSIGEWFNNLKEWIKAIPDKISEMIKNMGDWFKSIGDKIVDMVKSVGQFFSDLGQKIVDVFNDVKDWFMSLFTIPDGFGEEYKAKWQSFLKEHFGLLYQSVNMVTDTIGRIADGLVEKKHYITFPQIKLPWIDTPIVQAQPFCFEDFVATYSWSKILYDLYCAGIWGAFAFMFINLGMKKYNNVLGVHG